MKSIESGPCRSQGEALRLHGSLNLRSQLTPKKHSLCGDRKMPQSPNQYTKIMAILSSPFRTAALPKKTGSGDVLHERFAAQMI